MTFSHLACWFGKIDLADWAVGGHPVGNRERQFRRPIIAVQRCFAKSAKTALEILPSLGRPRQSLDPF
jgi:hypothetical protein